MNRNKRTKNEKYNKAKENMGDSMTFKALKNAGGEVNELNIEKKNNNLE